MEGEGEVGKSRKRRWGKEQEQQMEEELEEVGRICESVGRRAQCVSGVVREGLPKCRWLVVAGGGAEKEPRQFVGAN